MGYLIALVIIFGVVMIVSAPLLVDNSDKTEVINQPNNIIPSEMSNIETRLNEKFSELENRMDAIQNSFSTSNKYVCTIEGKLDENGNTVSVDDISQSKKFVFVCEYKYWYSYL